jgi:glutaredoxin
MSKTTICARRWPGSERPSSAADRRDFHQTSVSAVDLAVDLAMDLAVYLAMDLARWRANATLLQQKSDVAVAIRSSNQEQPLSLTRREFLSAPAVLTLGTTGIIGTVLPPLSTLAFAANEPSLEDLAHAGPDGDVVLGPDNAPVTIIEYASMTCPHCAHFEATTFPELKKRYIDTGKVRYMMREFPLDAIAAAGFMLARCAGKDKYEAIIETLFEKQADWAVQQKVLDNIQEVRDHAVNKLLVNSTPTFFINGKRLVGDLSIETIAKEVDHYLKEK